MQKLTLCPSCAQISERASVAIASLWPPSPWRNREHAQLAARWRVLARRKWTRAARVAQLIKQPKCDGHHHSAPCAPQLERAQVLISERSARVCAPGFWQSDFCIPCERGESAQAKESGRAIKLVWRRRSASASASAAAAYLRPQIWRIERAHTAPHSFCRPVSLSGGRPTARSRSPAERAPSRLAKLGAASIGRPLVPERLSLKAKLCFRSTICTRARAR